MRIKSYWMIFPVAMSLLFFEWQQLSFGGKAFFQGFLLSLPAFALYGVGFLLLRKTIRELSDKRLCMLRNMFIFLTVSLSVMIVISLLRIIGNETNIIAFVGLNTALAFVFLCFIIQGSNVRNENIESTEALTGNRYNPSNGLPTYSGYIDVKGNPVGSRITRS
ncbi:hypothetical protein [Kosakonia sacchari]|uniref:hypothetical protein n=1 Tax=Kosakonia sacchari TaxID=1158459 RepID=UPI001584C873|nr:hypothetical protein [Kosakonia sacchari]NUL39702.1 hypothetical protein [Kosakonia sacchari]